ncbi:MAG: hypothetical protein NUV67_03130, partial [archaeon]|nr:hypothetical protein [archaeon]
QGMSTLLKKMDASHSKIIYVNLNELYTPLINHLKGLGIDPQKFFFVDAITMTSDKEATLHDNCIFVSSPNALIELSLAISQSLHSQEADAILFDSLSTLLIYENESTVTKFVHSLIGKIKASGLDAYFTALEGDSQSEAIKDLSMFVDRVNTLTEFELGKMGFPTRHLAMALPKDPLIQKGFSIGPSPFTEKQIKDRAQPSKVVQAEMNYLKKRLDEMQGDKEVTKTLSELKGKMSKIDNLTSLQEEVKRLSEKIEKASEKKSESQVEKKAPEVDPRLVEHIGKLSTKIDALEEKLAAKMQAGQESAKRKTLEKELSFKKKQLELEQMMREFNKEPIRAPVKKSEKNEFDKKIEGKKQLLTKAYRKGFLSADSYKNAKSMINKEKKRAEHSVLVASLEARLHALNEAYDSGLISKESYLKGKERIEKLLKK